MLGQPLENQLRSLGHRQDPDDWTSSKAFLLQHSEGDKSWFFTDRGHREKRQRIPKVRGKFHRYSGCSDSQQSQGSAMLLLSRWNMPFRGAPPSHYEDFASLFQCHSPIFISGQSHVLIVKDRALPLYLFFHLHHKLPLLPHI